MMDSAIAISGMRINFEGNIFEVLSAGVADDIPYATIKPENRVVATAVAKAMPFPPSLQEIEAELTQKAKTK